MSLHMLSGIQVPQSFDLPKMPSPAELKADEARFDEALALLKEKHAFLIAHYYTSSAMQRLAEVSGGFIGDSLEMARVGRDQPEQLLAVAGVRFMGETAKILSPDKMVVMPDLKAECSLDLCCTEDQLRKVKAEHPKAVVVAYANTSAAVKAQADWIVTSSLAVELGEYLAQRGDEIIWVPDRHLGSYIANSSGADIYCWPGRCIVHDSFEANALNFVKEKHPEAKILVHPEAPAEVVAQADFVGSTSQILNYAKHSEAHTLIVATERNIFYKISQACPDKELIEAPVASRSGHCISCANCPWMQLNSIGALIEALRKPLDHSVYVADNVRTLALRPLNRMLKFAAAVKSGAPVPPDL